jgi:hypothetical protein
MMVTREESEMLALVSSRRRVEPSDLVMLGTLRNRLGIDQQET